MGRDLDMVSGFFQAGAQSDVRLDIALGADGDDGHVHCRIEAKVDSPRQTGRPSLDAGEGNDVTLSLPKPFYRPCSFRHNLKFRGY